MQGRALAAHRSCCVAIAMPLVRGSAAPSAPVQGPFSAPKSGSSAIQMGPPAGRYGLSTAPNYAAAWSPNTPNNNYGGNQQFSGNQQFGGNQQYGGSQQYGGGYGGGGQYANNQVSGLGSDQLRYLEEHGYHARLQQYVGAATTPENVVLVASPTPTGASGVA